MTTISIFAGANRTLAALAHNTETNQIAFASHNTVQITSSLVKEDNLNTNFSTHLSLVGPKGEVTCVQWIEEKKVLICGDQKGKLTVWSYEQGQGDNVCEDIQYNLLEEVPVSEHSITCMQYQDNCLVLGDSQGGLFVIQYADSIGKPFKYQLPMGFFSLDIRLVSLSKGEFIAFIGGSKPTLHIITIKVLPSDVVYSLVVSLPGHEDWVKSLSIKQINDQEYLIATGCLDRVIRIWKLTLESLSQPEYIETNKLKILTSKEYKFTTTEYRAKVVIDAVLMGHDDWIGSLIWKKGEELVLMSTSADSSIIIWKLDPENIVWYPDIKLGGVSIKGASTATGASGGFFSLIWNQMDNGREIVLTNGKTGSLRCWVKEPEGIEYIPKPCITGATLSVTDLSWEQNGTYLLSTSLDQTTRLFAKSSITKEWVEFGRPQIHGFDMITVKTLSPTQFVSAGDEKVIRVFQMPKPISNMLSNLTSFVPTEGEDVSLPETATLPVLGLSNKANFDNTATLEDQPNEEGQNENFATTLINELDEAPMEDVLQRYTLWPETDKLYGHGFEITTLDISPDSEVVVSASRSNVYNHAGLRVFGTKDWLEIDQGQKGGLLGHDLTVTKVRFNGKVAGQGKINERVYLLAVSRDRKLTLWEKQADTNTFKLVELVDRAHSRIIWDCCWVESENDIKFLTGSRDKELKLWALVENKLQMQNSLKFSVAITSVDSFALGNGKFKVAVGLDNGEIHQLDLDTATNELTGASKIALVGGTVTSVKFSPAELLLAVGSADSSLRLLKF